MMELYYCIGFILSVLLGLFILPNILLVSHKKHLYDMPDARKVHKTPVPRLGGLSFFPVMVVSMSLTLGFGLTRGDFASFDTVVLSEFLALLSGLTMLYLVGEVDDLISVGYRNKFVVQTVAAVLLVASGNWFHSFFGLFGIWDVPSWVGMPVTVFVIIFVTNSINLIDGIDGLASGLTIVSLATMSVLLMLGFSEIYILLSVVAMGVVLPFWFYNVFGNALQGNKLFMGDTGSLTLGYVLGFILLQFGREIPDLSSCRFMIIAFSSLLVPILDVVRVAFHRIRKGRNPFLPDKNHIHHKLLRAGMKKKRFVLLTIIAIDIFFIALNALLATHVNVTWIILTDVVLWTLLQLVINHYIRKNHGGPSYIPSGE